MFRKRRKTDTRKEKGIRFSASPKGETEEEDIPNVSDEHMPWGLIRVLLNISDELHDGTSHEIWLINLELVTDGGHVFLEDQRHPQAGLVMVFFHICSPLVWGFL